MSHRLGRDGSRACTRGSGAVDPTDDVAGALVGGELTGAAGGASLARAASGVEGGRSPKRQVTGAL